MSSQSHSESGQKEPVSRAQSVLPSRPIKTKPNMESTNTQSSAIYFKRHKGSKCRAALFRRLRATSSNQTRDVTQKTVDNAYIPQGFRPGQLSLRGFAS